jgi:hypothetical protein
MFPAIEVLPTPPFLFAVDTLNVPLPLNNVGTLYPSYRNGFVTPGQLELCFRGLDKEKGLAVEASPFRAFAVEILYGSLSDF